jgi:hypothetical protein
MLYQVWTDDDYVYAATTSGLYIIDGYTEEQVAYVSSVHAKSVFADDTYIYIGTSAAGVKRLSISDIEQEGDLSTSLIDYVKAPDIASNRIKYIHGNDNNLILCTEEGVDIIYKSSTYVVSSTISGTPHKCFALDNNYYYTVSGTTSWTLNRVGGVPSNNFLPNKTYTTGVGFLSNATRIKDFYVTENTSTEGNYNTIFVALDESVSVYDEGSGKYIEFTTVS